jgi:cell division FtsZ-interacting protein ZapD
MHFKCSGIKHCKFHHPEILEDFLKYSQVDAEHIDSLRQRVQSIQRNLPASTQVMQSTETYAKYILSLYFLDLI